MKIKTWVTFEKEVEVVFTAKDIADALRGSTDTTRDCLLGINSVAAYLKSVPETAISDMTEAQRKLIATFLREQLERFIPAP